MTAAPAAAPTTRGSTAPVLIYDGDCGICQASVDRARRIAEVDAIPFQRADLAGFGLTRAQAQDRMWIVHPVEGLRGGADAVAALLLTGESRLVRLAGRTLRLPLVRTVARGIYRLVARNRHRFPVRGARCAVDAGASPSPGRRSS